MEKDFKKLSQQCFFRCKENTFFLNEANNVCLIAHLLFLKNKLNK